MVDCKRIGRGWRKGWGESWSLHSYRGHEPEGKEIWKRLKQSLGCIAHSRTLPWLALFLLRRPKWSWRGEFPHAEGVKAQGAAVCRTFAMPQGEVNLVEKRLPSNGLNRICVQDKKGLITMKNCLLPALAIVGIALTAAKTKADDGFG